MPSSAADVPFRTVPLDTAPFQALFATDDDALRRLGIRRVTATSSPGFPCRVSLRDADIGETLLLLPHVHHDVPGPYRSSGPIYVREHAAAAAPADGELPPVLEGRQLSIRAYAENGMMRNAAVAEGEAIRGTIGALFADPKVAYLHVHNALPGCFSCRVERARA
ncbi:MAG: DUF1203 domain-containing protein [Acidobacteriota bacterium]